MRRANILSLLGVEQSPRGNFHTVRRRRKARQAPRLPGLSSPSVIDGAKVQPQGYLVVFSDRTAREHPVALPENRAAGPNQLHIHIDNLSLRLMRQAEVESADIMSEATDRSHVDAT